MRYVSSILQKYVCIYNYIYYMFFYVHTYITSPPHLIMISQLYNSLVCNCQRVPEERKWCTNISYVYTVYVCFNDMAVPQNNSLQWQQHVGLFLRFIVCFWWSNIMKFPYLPVIWEGTCHMTVSYKFCLEAGGSLCLSYPRVGLSVISVNIVERSCTLSPGAIVWQC